MNPLLISIIIPVYRGELTLTPLIDEIDKVKEQFTLDHFPIRIQEVIFVDDGAVDHSGIVLKEIAQSRPWVRIITLSKNFGQHPATIAGILYSCGDWIVTMDEDLQHHPKFITRLLKEAIIQELDIVYANPLTDVHESYFRDISSRSAKKLVATLSRNKYIPLFNSFRLIRGSIARAAAAVSIEQTYFDVALTWFTSRIVSIGLPLKDLRYINTGNSGYSVWKLLSHARRLLQSSQLKFLRFGAAIGLMVMFAGLVGIAVTIVIKVYFPEIITVQGWASTVILILLLSGLNAFLIGMVLEYLSIVLIQTHGKPKFFEIDRSIDPQIMEWFNKFKS